MTSSPFERSVTSLAISTKATAEDSGGGVTCAKISFFGVAWANAGALASERSPAAPAACRTRRRVAEAVIVTAISQAIVFVVATIAARLASPRENHPVIARSGATKQSPSRGAQSDGDCFA